MASKGNTIEGWEPSPWTHAPNANVANEKTMTSAQAQAARAKSAEVMAALKKGEPGDADKLLVCFCRSCVLYTLAGLCTDYCFVDQGPSRQKNDSLIPGMGRLKDRILNGKSEKEEEKVIR